MPTPLWDLCYHFPESFEDPLAKIELVLSFPTVSLGVLGLLNWLPRVCLLFRLRSLPPLSLTVPEHILSVSHSSEYSTAASSQQVGIAHFMLEHF